MAQTTIYSLPRELIDRIIDTVAGLTHKQATYHDALQVKDIVACSLVSKAFHYRAQAHLLWRLHIRANDDFKMRAKSLLDRVKNTPWECCEPLLDSFCCAVVTNSPGCGTNMTLDPRGHPGYIPKPTTLDKIYAHLGDHFPDILHGISNPRYKLQHFSLVSLSEFNLIDNHGAGPTILAFHTAFVNACTTVNLQTLHLANIANIPQSLVIEVFRLPSLEELTLNNLEFLEDTEAYLMSPDLTTRQSGNSSSRTLAPRLRRLEMRNICYPRLFNLLRFSTESNTPSSLAFTFMKTLITSIPFDEHRIPVYGSLREIMSFMDRIASNLVSLEIESYAYPADPHALKHFNANRTRILLNRLSALRTFRFSMLHDTSLDFLRRLLMDARSTTIETFEIKMTSMVPLASDPFHTHRYWSQLDDRLTSPSLFKRLRKVRIIMILFDSQMNAIRCHSSVDGTYTQQHTSIKKHWESIFPKVTASGMLEVDVQEVYSRNAFEAYLYASRTDDGIID